MAMLYSFDWKSAIEHDGVLKCVIVYLARVIPAFVMYCVNGASCSSLLRVYRLYDYDCVVFSKRPLLFYLCVNFCFFLIPPLSPPLIFSFLPLFLLLHNLLFIFHLLLLRLLHFLLPPLLSPPPPLPPSSSSFSSSTSSLLLLLIPPPPPSDTNGLCPRH